MRRKKERSKQGQTNKQGKATQHTHVHVYISFVPRPVRGPRGKREVHFFLERVRAQTIRKVQAGCNHTHSEFTCAKARGCKHMNSTVFW